MATPGHHVHLADGTGLSCSPKLPLHMRRPSTPSGAAAGRSGHSSAAPRCRGQTGHGARGGAASSPASTCSSGSSPFVGHGAGNEISACVSRAHAASSALGDGRLTTRTGARRYHVRAGRCGFATTGRATAAAKRSVRRSLACRGFPAHKPPVSPYTRCTSPSLLWIFYRPAAMGRSAVAHPERLAFWCCWRRR